MFCSSDKCRTLLTTVLYILMVYPVKIFVHYYYYHYVYVANFEWSTIHCRIISYNQGQGKVEFHALYDCSTSVASIFWLSKNMGIALRRSEILFLFLWGVSGPPETQLIHTLSKFHCLLHELHPTNHHSSQEVAIYGASYHISSFPESYIWPSFKSLVKNFDFNSLSS